MEVHQKRILVRLLSKRYLCANSRKINLDLPFLFGHLIARLFWSRCTYVCFQSNVEWRLPLKQRGNLWFVHLKQVILFISVAGRLILLKHANFLLSFLETNIWITYRQTHLEKQNTTQKAASLLYLNTEIYNYNILTWLNIPF